MGRDAQLSRRGVMALGASAGAAALLAGPLGSVAGAAAPATSRSAVAAITGLRRDHWTGLVGRTVSIAGQAVTVVRVDDLIGAPRGDAKRFSVELRTARAKPNVGGTTPVVIPGRGTATLLVTPIDRGARYRAYQIVVSAA